MSCLGPATELVHLFFITQILNAVEDLHSLLERVVKNTASVVILEEEIQELDSWQNMMRQTADKKVKLSEGDADKLKQVIKDIDRSVRKIRAAPLPPQPRVYEY
jgi:hypothetical protein